MIGGEFGRDENADPLGPLDSEGTPSPGVDQAYLSVWDGCSQPKPPGRSRPDAGPSKTR